VPSRQPLRDRARTSSSSPPTRSSPSKRFEVAAHDYLMKPVPRSVSVSPCPFARVLPCGRRRTSRRLAGPHRLVPCQTLGRHDQAAPLGGHRGLRWPSASTARVHTATETLLTDNYSLAGARTAAAEPAVRCGSTVRFIITTCGWSRSRGGQPSKYELQLRASHLRRVPAYIAPRPPRAQEHLRL